MNDQKESYQAFTVYTDDRGVTTVALNVPGRPFNVLDRNVMNELDAIVQRLESNTDVELVLFRSNKESGFLAGADVGAIAEIDSPADARKLIEAGQALFHRIEGLPMPTVVAIDGPCLGGGLEWSLACRYRVARDSDGTKIGLPEIKLGLIPGWGGTQRLPKRVGLTRALTMIMRGSHLDAKQAFACGLVDAAISPDCWDLGVNAFINDILQDATPHKRSLMQRISRRLELCWPIRSVILSSARRKVASKSGQYPALAAAIRAIAAGCDRQPDGYAIEKTEFTDLLATATCRNLLSLFFSRERARSPKTWISPDTSESIHKPPIQKIGVIGGGAMGAGIGQFAATRGFDVTIKEIDLAAATAAQKRIDGLFGRYASRKSLTPQQAADLERRVHVTIDDQSLVDVDLVIEAIVEREDVKRSVFAHLGRTLYAETILATNTSSLSVTRIASATDRTEKVAGLHFFNPVHRMELVEVVRGEYTNQETIAALVRFTRALGKTPVVTADSPGFLVNRVLFPYLGEAVLAHSEGMTVTEIDSAARNFGMPMGPLELLDQVGLDVALHVSMSLRGVLPAVDSIACQLQKMVDENRLGKKSGVGFYRYRNGQPVRRKRPRGSVNQLDHLQQRLIYPMLAEAVRCLEQGVVKDGWAIDLAMVLGTGFAPHLGGPLRAIETIGREKFVTQMRVLQTQHGDRFAVPDSSADRRVSHPIARN